MPSLTYLLPGGKEVPDKCRDDEISHDRLKMTLSTFQGSSLFSLPIAFF